MLNIYHIDWVLGCIFDISHPFLPSNACPLPIPLLRWSWFYFYMFDFEVNVTWSPYDTIWWDRKNASWEAPRMMLCETWCALFELLCKEHPVQHCCRSHTLQLCLTVPQYLSNAVKIRFVAQSIGFTKFSLCKNPVFSWLWSINLQLKIVGKRKELFLENWV